MSRADTKGHLIYVMRTSEDDIKRCITVAFTATRKRREDKRRDQHGQRIAGRKAEEGQRRTQGSPARPLQVRQRSQSPAGRQEEDAGQQEHTRGHAWQSVEFFCQERFGGKKRFSVQLLLKNNHVTTPFQKCSLSLSSQVTSLSKPLGSLQTSCHR